MNGGDISQVLVPTVETVFQAPCVLFVYLLMDVPKLLLASLIKGYLPPRAILSVRLMNQQLIAHMTSSEWWSWAVDFAFVNN